MENQHPKRTYTPEDVTTALERIRKDGMKVYKASKLFGIPKSTLLNKFHGKHPGARGAPKIMDEDDELLLVDMLELFARMGQPLDRNHFKFLAYKITSIYPKGKRKFGIEGPSDECIDRFLKDHPNVTLRTPEDVTKGVGYVTAEELDKWFQKLIDYLKADDVDLFDFFQAHPQNVLNLDESGFDLNIKPKKIFTLKSIPHAYKKEPAKHRDRVTGTLCVSADGHVLPPQIILKSNFARMGEIAETFGEHHMKLYHAQTKNGWQDTTSFFAYLKKVVSNCRKRKEVSGPLLIFVDGHPSHLDLEIYRWCQANDVIYVVLFPNSTHLIQPCDLTVFRPLKSTQQKVTEKYKRDTGKNELNEIDFINIFTQSVEETFYCEEGKQKIRNGFRASGLHPLNRQAVNDERLIGRSSPKNNDHRPPTIPSHAPNDIPTTSSTHDHSQQANDSSGIFPELPDVRSKEEINSDLINSILYYVRQWEVNNEGNSEALLSSSIFNQQLVMMKKFSTQAEPPTRQELLESLFRPIAQLPVQKRKRKKLPSVGVMSNKAFLKALEKEKEQEKAQEEAKESRRQARDKKAQEKASKGPSSSGVSKPRGRPPAKKQKIDQQAVVSDESSDSD